MSKRRRMFEIDIPAEIPADSTVDTDVDAALDAAVDTDATEERFPVGNRKSEKKRFPTGNQDIPEGLETKSAMRRGPMATAVRESAAAVRARAVTEEAVREENDRLAHEHVRLKQLGLITDRVPLDLIDTNKLRRDRAPGTDEELDDLIESIRAIGLSNPIRVEKAGDRYELIQGFRRLQAYRALHAQAGDDTWATIPAGMVAPGDDLVTSYRRMVDENLIRKDISFAEMATLARDYAADPEIEVVSVAVAVSTLYASASKQKRSYIRAFAELLEMLDKDLRFPEAIPRNLGMEIRRQLSEGRPGLGELQKALKARPGRSADIELAILRGFVGASDGAPMPQDGGAEEGRAPAPVVRKAKTTFRIAMGTGEVKCTAADGKLELRGATDFSGYERRSLEAAVEAFFATLDDRS
ncbi:MAG: ParB N-terminal domain-containing protein [Pseudomonadota bacterium]